MEYLFLWLQEARTAGLDKLSLESLNDFKKYREQILYDADDGWRTEVVTVTSEEVDSSARFEPISVRFHYRDMMHFLRTEFGNEAYRGGHFVLRPERPRVGQKRK